MKYVMQEMDGSGHQETVFVEREELEAAVEDHLDENRTHYAAVGSDGDTELIGRQTQEVLDEVRKREVGGKEEVNVLFIPQVSGGDGAVR